MGVPLIQAYRVGRYIAGRKLRGAKRYPLVLMLEPLFQCNLACAGCGKIDYPKEILQKRMSVADALQAVDECGAPMVSIPGGEPLIHKDIAADRRRHRGAQEVRLPVHERDSAGEAHRRVPASPYLTFSIHLDGNQRSATMSRCARRGCSTRPSRPSGWRARKGFRVTVNCTLFSGEDPDEVAEFFDDAMALGIEGDHRLARLSVIITLHVRMSSWAAASASSCSAKSSSAGASARGVRWSFNHSGCSWTSWRVTRPISALRGAIPPTILWLAAPVLSAHR